MSDRIGKHEQMLMVAHVMGLRSTCPRRRVGCVLVDVGGKIIGSGYNGVPSGMGHCITKPCGGQSHASGVGLESCHAVHAEQNALMQCGNVMDIHVAYVSASPCIHCMKMLLNSACSVIYHTSAVYDEDAVKLWRSMGRVIERLKVERTVFEI